MTVDLLRAPFPVTYRELWLPENIRSSQMPSMSRGNALTITGGARRTTADGVRFLRGANSHVDLGAIHNSQAKLWLSFRFKLDQTFAAGAAASMRLFGKSIDADNLLELYLFNTDGRLYFKHRSGAVTLFDMGPAQSSWTAGTWYHLIASISSTAGARLIVDNGTATTSADTTTAPAGGSLVIGDQSVGGGLGLSGVITDIAIGTDDLSANEESDLFKGIPPLDSTHVYTCDEGRGATIYDRGSSPANGTIGSAASWSFGQVVQPILSLDGVGDRATTPTNILLSGDWTLFAVLKMHSSLNVQQRELHSILTASIDAANQFNISGDTSSNGLYFWSRSAGTSPIVSAIKTVSIGDYVLVIITKTAAGVVAYYFNGYQLISGSLNGPTSPTPGVIELGHNTPSWNPYNGGGKFLLCGLIEGVLTAKQVRNYSRWLKDMFNLPVTI